MILGLSFKPKTDDIRDSVSLKIIDHLLLIKGIKIFAHDPIAVDNAKKLYTNNKNVFFIKNWKKSISIVDIIVITTKWSEYKQLTSKKIIMKLKNNTIFDA